MALEKKPKNQDLLAKYWQSWPFAAWDTASLHAECLGFDPGSAVGSCFLPAYAHGGDLLEMQPSSLSLVQSWLLWAFGE